VGIRAQALAKAALEAGMKKEQVMMLNDAGTLGELLLSLVQDGDVVLVKGSQSMRMERTVEALLEDPSRKRELLVRQDDEWEKR
jgi:UDP-N-acetylmuramyl pentapeptide synthase